MLFFPVVIFSQNLQEGEFIWSKERKLQKEDYKLITRDNNVPIRSAINFSYHLRGFNVFNNNFNRNIINKFSRNSSALNPVSDNISAMIAYQQLNFDLSEVYARKMRKELLIHKNKLWKGFDYADSIFNNLTVEYVKTQALMNEETHYGLNVQKLQDWNQKINDELEGLSEFDYNNTSKIKIKKSSKEDI
ncbi:hypothetical protein SAMN05421542_3374 [Chryseobacterium jejuense]|uniref:Uncharacterized protein n=1 Tax=Chryseobacterium jejuense TaxID=445960 RepID=A0A2X2XCX8_CHRJE|nr:hypothetical protein SAMN05421542_3374 [Chryseobacterium jejuense]SQB45875.1 Uncharacterised protein [Chryseobacterium jejuense]